MSERRDLVGGSDVAALLGVSPWSTPFTVWDRIVNGTPMEETEIMLEGRLIEPFLAARHLSKRPHTNFVAGPELRHPRTPYAIGHLDAVTDEAVLEFKAVHWSKRASWDNGIPAHVQLQVDHYLQCADRPRAEVGAFFGLGDFRIYDFTPLSEDVRGGIIEVIERFWRDHVETKIAPPMGDTRRSAEQYLAWIYREHPVANETELALDPETTDLAKQYIAINKDLAQMGAAKTFLKAELVKRMGSNKWGVGPGVKVTCVSVRGAKPSRKLEVEETA